MNTEIISYVVLGVSALAFIISVITQVTKEVGFLAKIPTALQVIVLSLVLTPLAVLALSQYTGKFQITWYIVVGSVLAGFFVAFVCMYGWEKLSEIYNKFKK